jgi:putative DNA primase/helicase
MRFERIQDRANGKWRSILVGIGINEKFLTAKHGPCPLCDGTDRFRWDDKKGSGSYFCNRCGAGSGVDLVMKFKGVNFLDARKLIEAELPQAVVAAPKAKRGIDPARYVEMWRMAQPLSGVCPASKYLDSRGVGGSMYPSQLRFMPKATYVHDDGKKTYHPAMLALFVSPDAKAATVHFTYLDERGRKADVPKVRKLAPCPIPSGGAVRLSSSASIMGVAEGIETALSASRLFDMPVWAALSATGLMKWQPPTTCRHVFVFGDADASFGGQHKAYALAYRLRTEGFAVTVELPRELGRDWNDEVREHHHAMAAQ